MISVFESVHQEPSKASPQQSQSSLSAQALDEPETLLEEPRSCQGFSKVGAAVVVVATPPTKAARVTRDRGTSSPETPASLQRTLDRNECADECQRRFKTTAVSPVLTTGPTPSCAVEAHYHVGQPVPASATVASSVEFPTGWCSEQAVSLPAHSA